MSRGAVSPSFKRVKINADPTPASRYTANRQPGKALPFFLRLRRPNVFDLIRENNLWTDVQDQALLLVEFDHELMERRRKEELVVYEESSEAIGLLVEHLHSIPVGCLFFVLFFSLCSANLRVGVDWKSGTATAKSAVLSVLISGCTHEEGPESRL